MVGLPGDNDEWPDLEDGWLEGWYGEHQIGIALVGWPLRENVPKAKTFSNLLTLKWKNG